MKLRVWLCFALILVCAAGVARADLHGALDDTLLPIAKCRIDPEAPGCFELLTRPPEVETARPVTPAEVCGVDAQAIHHALVDFGFLQGLCVELRRGMTRAAIRDFQAYMTFPATGILTAWEEDLLREAHVDLLAGVGVAYPVVMAQVGPRGLLQIRRDPAFAERFPPLAAGTPLPLIGSPMLPPGWKTPEHICEAISLFLQIHPAGTKSPDVSPGSKPSILFCEARDAAVAMGQRELARFATSEEEIADRCGLIEASYADVVLALSAVEPDEVLFRAAAVSEPLGLTDPETGRAYGEICLGLGYEQDDALMALTATLVLLGAGERGYGELVAHHLREGMGVPASPEAARTWYAWTLDALEAGAEALFDTGTRADGSDVIRALLARNAL